MRVQATLAAVAVSAVCGALAGLTAEGPAAAAAAAAPAALPGFVTTGTTASGRPGFVVQQADGSTSPFRYGGTNVYYLHYKSQYMVDSALQKAADNNFTVIRMWTFLDNPTDCSIDAGWGVQMQCWDPTSNSVYINTTTVARLDYVLARAAALGLRLVLTFTNNWSDFGGIGSYLAWRNRTTSPPPPPQLYHDDFYTDPVIKGWYKAWIKALVTRTNAITGIPYSQDPTIFAWQLANEPRCNAPDQPASRACVNGSTTLLTPWVAEMSAYVKSLDPQHMVSVGDEGFYCNPAEDGCPADAWWCNCNSGVDTLAFAAVPSISYGTAHLYPEPWGEASSAAAAAAWGVAWIANHTAQQHAQGKPFVVEEFGMDNVTSQAGIYTQWVDAAVSGGTDAFHFWMLVGLNDGGKDWYSGDALNIICWAPGDPPTPPGHDNSTCGILRTAAQAMLGG